MPQANPCAASAFDAYATQSRADCFPRPRVSFQVASWLAILGVSRNTVASALDQLIAEGYLEARIGWGTFVAKTLYEARVRSVATQRPLPRIPRNVVEVKAKLDEVGSSFGALRVGEPDLSVFPIGCGAESNAKILRLLIRISTTASLPVCSRCAKRFRGTSGSSVAWSPTRSKLSSLKERKARCI